MTKKELKMEEFQVQQWLCREFIEKLKKNNVKRVMIWTEDKHGDMRLTEYMLTNKKLRKKALDFIKS